MQHLGKKLHLHISVDDIEEAIEFYTIQLHAKPTKVKKDYAQWLIDDLSLNFAISTRGYKKGLNHLGIQYESSEALKEAQTLFEKHNIIGKEDTGAVCCYKESDKYWVKDPTGIVWENYHSMNDVEVFGEDGANSVDGCCMPTSENPSETPSCSSSQDTKSCCN